MAVFPLYPTRIEKGGVRKKTEIFESASGMEQRVAIAATRKTYLLDIEGVPTTGVIDVGHLTQWKNHMQSGNIIIYCPYFNLDNYLHFFEVTANGAANAFTLPAWGRIIPYNVTVRLSDDNLNITYISNDYCNINVEVVTTLC